MGIQEHWKNHESFLYFQISFIWIADNHASGKKRNKNSFIRGLLEAILEGRRREERKSK